MGNAKAIETSDESLAPGTRLGSYEVIRPIAEGGMGVVYEARHVLTGVHRAVKIIRRQLSRSPEFRARFLREATIASSLRHPNLVETSDPTEVDGMLVLPMELLRGRSLSARLGRDGRLSLEETAAIVVPVAMALQAVHAKGVIHRDLKPANVILAEVDGHIVPKILDFGVARDVADDEHTTTGQVVGSAAYMAPEQAEGRRDLDPRIDQFAVGVIAYRCLTGRPVYESDDTGSAMSKLIRHRPFPPPRSIAPELPEALEAVVLRALSFDREGRFPDLAAFAAAFTQALTAPPPLAFEPPPSIAPASGPGRALPLAILALALAAAAGVAAWLLLGHRPGAQIVSTPLPVASPTVVPPPAVPSAPLVPTPLAPLPPDPLDVPAAPPPRAVEREIERPPTQRVRVQAPTPPPTPPTATSPRPPRDHGGADHHSHDFEIL